MTALGNAFQSQHRENELWNEVNRQISDENTRQILHRHTEDTRRERQQESSIQMKNIESFFHKTKQSSVTEPQQITAEFTQTIMDVKGLATRVQRMDKDLQATSEVAATTSGYLDKATEDYKKPNSVEYKTIMTLTQPPSKQEGTGTLDIRQRPPLGVARKEC